MRHILLFIFSGIFLANSSQDTINKQGKNAEHYNLIKLGSSIQADFIPGEYDYYYSNHNYRSTDYYFEGYNTKIYLAYEHIWEYKNKTAVALEPMAGISFHENSTHAFIGNNTKFYWANRDIWRMGIAIYTGFSYANHPSSMVVSKEDGNYYERVDVKMHYHMLSTNISIIPFQFRFRNVPLVIESQFGMVGINILSERSEWYNT